MFIKKCEWRNNIIVDKNPFKKMKHIFNEFFFTNTVTKSC